MSYSLAASAEMLFTDLPFVERVLAIHERGLGVEIWDWTQKDLHELAEVITGHKGSWTRMDEPTARRLAFLLGPGLTSRIIMQMPLAVNTPSSLQPFWAKNFPVSGSLKLIRRSTSGYRPPRWDLR